MSNETFPPDGGSIEPLKDPKNDKQMVFDYYLSLFEKNGAKHNHKEASAWGGLILYAAFCGTLISSSFSTDAMLGFGSHNELSIWRWVLLVSLGMMTLAMGLYLRNQLKLKDRASARIASASSILSEILTQPHQTVEYFIETSAPQCCKRQKHRPRKAISAFLQFLHMTKDKKHSGEGVLPKRFIERECYWYHNEVKGDWAIWVTKATVFMLLCCTGLITASVLLAKTGQNSKAAHISQTQSKGALQ